MKVQGNPKFTLVWEFRPESIQNLHEISTNKFIFTYNLHSVDFKFWIFTRSFLLNPLNEYLVPDRIIFSAVFALWSYSCLPVTPKKLLVLHSPYDTTVHT